MYEFTSTNYLRVCVLKYMCKWGLSYIPLPGIGPLGRTCATLARTCARTVAQKLVFVDLGLRSFRVDCAQAFLSSVFVVHTATHKESSR